MSALHLTQKDKNRDTNDFQVSLIEFALSYDEPLPEPFVLTGPRMAITTNKKKAGLNLSPACLLSKLCYDAVLVGCYPRAELLARLRSGRSRVELRCFRRTFERGG